MGFRHKLAYSFFDFSAYKEFLLQGLGKSILYIFLVTIIFSTITNIKQISLINSELSNIQDNLTYNGANFELKNGLLSIDSNEPIYYKHDGEFLFNFLFLSVNYLDTLNAADSEAHNVMDNSSAMGSENNLLSTSTDRPNYYMIIADTNGKTNPSILNTYKDGIYINSTNLFLRKDYRTIETIEFSKCSWINLNKDSVLNILNTFKFTTPLLLLLLEPITAFIHNLILGFLIFGPLTLLIGSFMGVKLNYSKACTLSFYAMTLPILLQALLNVAEIEIPGFFIVFYMITLLYCGLALNEIKNTNKSNLNFMQ